VDCGGTPVPFATASSFRRGKYYLITWSAPVRAAGAACPWHNVVLKAPADMARRVFGLLVVQLAAARDIPIERWIVADEARAPPLSRRAPCLEPQHPCLVC
jgi:hypothetical protein